MPYISKGELARLRRTAGLSEKRKSAKRKKRGDQKLPPAIRRTVKGYRKLFKMKKKDKRYDEKNGVWRDVRGRFSSIIPTKRQKKIAGVPVQEHERKYTVEKKHGLTDWRRSTDIENRPETFTSRSDAENRKRDAETAGWQARIREI